MSRIFSVSIMSSYWHAYNLIAKKTLVKSSKNTQILRLCWCTTFIIQQYISEIKAKTQTLWWARNLNSKIVLMNYIHNQTNGTFVHPKTQVRKIFRIKCWWNNKNAQIFRLLKVVQYTLRLPLVGRKIIKRKKIDENIIFTI